MAQQSLTNLVSVAQHLLCAIVHPIQYLYMRKKSVTHTYINIAYHNSYTCTI